MRMLRIQPMGPDHIGGIRRMAEDEQQWQPGAAAASTATAAPRYGKGTFPENTPEQQPPTKGKAAPKGSDSKGSKGKGKGRKDKGPKGPYTDNRSTWRSTDWRSGGWSATWNSWSRWS